MILVKIENPNGIQNNSGVINALSYIPGDDNKQKLESINMLGKMKSLIDEGPLTYMRRNGPELEVEYFITFANELQNLEICDQNYTENECKLLFLIYAAYRFCLDQNLQLMAENGKEFFVPEFQSYVNEHGYDLSSFKECLENFLESNREFDDVPIIPEYPADNYTEDEIGDLLNFEIPLSFFNHVKSEMKTRISIPLKRVVGLKQEIESQLNFVILMSLKKPNGHIDKYKTRKILGSLTKKGVVTLTKEEIDGSDTLYCYKYMLDNDRMFEMTIFGGKLVMKPNNCVILNKRSFKNLRKTDLNMLDEDSVLLPDICHFLIFLIQNGFKLDTKCMGALGVVSINDKLDLYDSSFVQNDGKLTVIDRNHLGMSEEVKELGIYREMNEGTYVLYPERDYILIQMMHRFLCFPLEL